MEGKFHNEESKIKMSSDPNEFEYIYDENSNDSEPDLENENEVESKEIFGMSIPEIAIFGGLLIAILIFGGFVALRLVNNARITNEILPTVEPPTPTPSVTPFVKSTPIPGWNRFAFAEEKAEIWLPASFQGGDPVAYPEIIDLTIDVFIPDELHAEYAKKFIADSDITFFAFDGEPSVIWRSMDVTSESRAATKEFDMEEYLNLKIEDFSDRDIRVTNQYLNDLDYYSDVGILIFEEYIEIVEGEIYLFKFYLFFIRIDDEIWNLTYQILREDAAGFQDTIYNSARSFYLQP